MTQIAGIAFNENENMAGLASSGLGLAIGFMVMARRKK
jgi:hypothetical protein